MKAQELSQKYAAAIVSQALEQWMAALTAVQDKLAKDSALFTKLQDPRLTFEDRKKELDKIVPADSDQFIRNFLYTLLKEKNFDILANVVSELDRMVRGGPQQVQLARVTTAFPLGDEDKDQFRKKLQQKYGQALECAFDVDSSIVGGAIVQVGDKIIDGSVATRLESMSNMLGVK